MSLALQPQDSFSLAARLTGAIAQQNPSGITGGMVNYFAWALGGGAETKLSHSISVRTGADYLHTNFFVPDGNIRGQGNTRVSVAAVYTFANAR